MIADGFGRHTAILQIQYHSLLLDIAHHNVTDTDIFDHSSPAPGLSLIHISPAMITAEAALILASTSSGQW